MTSQTITALGTSIINLINRKTPIATASTVGMVKPDGNTININADGVISSNGGSGSGLEVCDIGMALYVDETKGLRRYLNGQIVDINTNTQAFLNRLKEITTLHPSLLCTEEEWQTAKTMSAFGQVGKFVFNYSGDNVVSVRIPRVVNVQGLFDLQNLGMTVSAGLPNVTGFGGIVDSNGNNYIGQSDVQYVEGAFYYGNKRSGINGANTGTNASVRFDASRSNSIYGNSDTVQPEAIQYPYFIQIATGSETENNIVNDIELNNPYSLFDSKYSDHELNNLSWLKSEGQWNAKSVYPTAYDKLLKVYNGTETIEGLSVKLSTETYTDYDFVLNTSDETFRLPLKTKLASGKAVVGNGISLGLTNGTNNLCVTGYNGSNQCYIAYDGYGKTIGTPLNSQAITTGMVATGITTDPTKSGIELSDSGLYLYYYVGETVQNANLIDAGRIGEQLSNCLTRNNKEEIVSWGMPDYSAGINISVPTQSAPYICQYDCYMQGVSYKSNYYEIDAYINGTQYILGGGNGNNIAQSNNIYLFLPKGTSIYFNDGYVWASSLYVFPLKGVK